MLSICQFENNFVLFYYWLKNVAILYFLSKNTLVATTNENNLTTIYEPQNMS